MSWKKIGDAASAVAERLSRRSVRDFDKLAPELIDLCQDFIDSGTDPIVLLVSIAATLSYCIAQIDPAYDAIVARKLSDTLPDIMSRAAEARKATKAPLQ